MWLTSWLTSHDLHGVGDPSSSLLTRPSTLVASPYTRFRVSVLICAPLVGGATLRRSAVIRLSEAVGRYGDAVGGGEGSTRSVVRASEERKSRSPA